MAVVGVGHLGKEHARILAGLPQVELVGVVDVNRAQAEAVARRCCTRAYGDYEPLLNEVDAAVIVVPTTHHHAIASEFLRRGTPLLVEKPLAINLQQAEDLVGLAKRHGTLLQVGHIERFNPAFEEFAQQPLQPRLVECERLGPFTGRSTDIGAVLDLMIHDLDLLLALVRAPVSTVEAAGIALFGGCEDVANARLTFANGCVANLTASRASPLALRRMRVWAQEGFAALDFANRHLTLIQPPQQHRPIGPGANQVPADWFGRYMQVVELDRNEGDQLTRELLEFLRSVQTGAPPRVTGVEGYNALALATRILEKVRSHVWEGQPSGPTDPTQWPSPHGPLLQPPHREAA
jgi:predicted dehydrogenase